MSEDTSQENSLPALLDEVVLEEPQYLPDTASEKDIQKADVQIMNNLLKAAHHGFSQVRSVVSLCRLIDTTASLLERRRKLLGMPYGAQGSTSKTFTVTPMD